jgi:predicted pPIWI-associating nuclease
LDNQPPSLEARIRAKLDDDFCQTVLTGALRVVSDDKNPIRLNLFAAAVRELFGHLLHARAPDANVTACSWFKQEENTEGPTRRQRAKYATQGGLSDEAVEELGVDVEDLHDRAIKAIAELNKHTHVRPGTIVSEQPEIETFVNGAMDALLGLLDSFEECRRTVLDALSEKIDDEAVTALITETIQEVDELASHHTVEQVDVESAVVVSISNDELCIRAEGTLYVELQWGSNSDLRRGDGATLDENFPFEVTMKSFVEDMSDFHDVSYVVDTSEWFGNGGDDDAS